MQFAHARNSSKRRAARVVRLAAALVFVLLFAGGCSIVETILDVTAAPESADGAEVIVVAETVSPSSEPTETADETPGPALGEGAEETPEPAETISTTTGRLLPEGAVYRPVLAVIDNAPAARPQTGLMLADIVYEFPLDRGDDTTRFLAVFSDQLPERIGPVRTSRYYLADAALEWNGLYVSLGDPETTDETYPLLGTTDLDFLALPEGDAADYFYTDNTISSLEEYSSFFRLLSFADAYYTTARETQATRFLFESGVQYGGSTLLSVSLPFSSSDQSRVVFTYDPETNLLTRSEKNSKNSLVTSLTLTPTDNALGYVSEPVTVQNLIVQYARVYSLDSDHRGVTLIGSGVCDFFINGHYTRGTWRRESLADPTVYKLNDGTVVRLEPGNTWIAVMPSNHEIRIRFVSGD